MGSTKFDLFNLMLANFAPLEDLPALISGVYCIYDEEDALLYVGQSCDVRGRLCAHRRKPWGPEIARVVAVRIGRESDRLIAEAVLILRHFPRHNRTVRLGLAHGSRTVRELQFLPYRKARGAKTQ